MRSQPSSTREPRPRAIRPHPKPTTATAPQPIKPRAAPTLPTPVPSPHATRQNSSKAVTRTASPLRQATKAPSPLDYCGGMIIRWETTEPAPLCYARRAAAVVAAAKQQRSTTVVEAAPSLPTASLSSSTLTHLPSPHSASPSYTTSLSPPLSTKPLLDLQPDYLSSLTHLCYPSPESSSSASTPPSLFDFHHPERQSSFDDTTMLTACMSYSLPGSPRDFGLAAFEGQTEVKKEEEEETDVGLGSLYWTEPEPSVDTWAW